MNPIPYLARHAGASVASRLLLAAVATVSALTAQSNAEKVEQTRPAIEKWVEARRTISLEKKDWAVGKEMLAERIAVLERELATVKAKTAETEKSIAEAERTRAELESKNEILKQSAQKLAASAAVVEAKTSALLARLPDPIRAKVRPLSQRLPEKPAETKTSLSERFRNVVGIVNEVNKFNREIVAESEVRQLADGSSAEVVAMYIGLGRAYYYNGGKAQGYKVGGFGVLTPAGWTWRADDASAPALALSAGMTKNETPAAFVRVPAKVE